MRGKLEFRIFFFTDCATLSNSRVNFCGCKYVVVLKASKINFKINLLRALNLKYQYCYVTGV